MMEEHISRRVYLVYLIIFVASFAILACATLKTEFVYMEVAKAHNTTKKHHSCVRNASTALDQQVTAEVSKWSLYLDVILFLPACFAGIIITSLGDKVGRKVAMAIPQIGAVLGGVILCLTIQFSWSLNILYISNFVSGLGGYYMTLLMQGYAFLSDVTSVGNRGSSYVILETSLGVGGGLAGILSGYWVDAVGFLQPLLCTVALNFACLLLIVALPNSTKIREENKKRKQVDDVTSYSNSPLSINSDDRDESDLESNEYSSLYGDDVRKTSYGSTSSSDADSCDKPNIKSKRKCTPFDLMRAVWSVYSSEYSHCEECHGHVGQERRIFVEGRCEHGGGRYPGRVVKMWLYLISYDILMFVIVGVGSFQTIYLLSEPLCFSPVLIGMQMLLYYGSVGAAPLVVMVYQKLVRFSNHTIILVGLVGVVINTAIIGFAAEPYIVFIGTAMMIAVNPAKPFIQLQMSTMVSEDEQGAVFSLLSFSEILSFLLATISFLTLYPATISIYHGFAWLVASGLSLLPLLLVTLIVCIDRRGYPQDGAHEPLIT